MKKDQLHSFRNWNHALRIFLQENPIINRDYIQRELKIPTLTWDKFINNEQGLPTTMIRKIIALISQTYIQFHFPNESDVKYVIHGKYEEIGEIRYCRYELQKGEKYRLTMVRTVNPLNSKSLLAEAIINITTTYVHTKLIPDNLIEIPPQEYEVFYKIAKSYYRIH